MVRYFITYSFQNPNGAIGFGDCELTLAQPITKLADVAALVTEMCKPGTPLFNLGIPTCRILGFSRFAEPRQ